MTDARARMNTYRHPRSEHPAWRYFLFICTQWSFDVDSIVVGRELLSVSSSLLTMGLWAVRWCVIRRALDTNIGASFSVDLTSPRQISSFRLIQQRQREKSVPIMGTGRSEADVCYCLWSELLDWQVRQRGSWNRCFLSPSHTSSWRYVIGKSSRVQKQNVDERKSACRMFRSSTGVISRRAINAIMFSRASVSCQGDRTSTRG